MKKNNKFLLMASFLSLFAIFLFGCAPKGDPSQVLNNYYENIKDGNDEGAYEILCQKSKESFPKEDFLKWQEIQKNISKLKQVKISKNNELTNQEIDGIKFKNIIEFNVSEKSEDTSNNKEEIINYKRYVVNDNGSWKVYRGKENPKDNIAVALHRLALTYMDGKKLDLNQAATILNEAIKENKEYIPIYYSLANTYARIQRYDDAINNINIYLSKEKDIKSQSDAYNVLGASYEGKGQFDKSKQCYLKAIKLNSNNQYAKTNLERVKQY